MGKGIGKQQKAILDVIRKHPGYVDEVYREIKNELFPDIEFIEPYEVRAKEIHALFDKCGYDQQTYKAWREAYKAWQENDNWLLKEQRKRFKADNERKAKLNRIRVSISTSVKGLINRGYVKKEKNKLFINPNACRGMETIS